MNRLSRREFGALLLGGAAPAWLSGCAGAGRREPGALRYGSPREQGVDAQGVLGFLDAAAAGGLDLHSFMLYRHGHVVAEGWWWPYRAARLHMMHSLTKSVTACGVGLAIAEGRFSLQDPIADCFPEQLPREADPRIRAITVRDLLTMQTGHGAGVSGSVWRQIRTSWVAEFFKLPLVHQPGTTFVYNSAASFMLSALVTRTTGLTLRDYLQPRLFEPLGIRKLTWDLSPGGINPGGNGLSWRTADALKLGIVHLRHGLWEERPVLPRAWVDAATRAQIPGGFYGYQWWVQPGGGNFYAWGLFGQFAFVFPEHDAVLAITAGTDGAKLPPLVWRHFPAAFTTQPGGAADARLSRRCGALRLLPPLARESSPLAQRISGRTFRAQDNADGITGLRLDFTAAQCRVIVQDARGTHTVVAGLEDWIESDTTLGGAPLHHEYEPDRMRIVAGGRWRDARTFEMTWQFVETAFQDRVVCRFEGDTLRWDRSVNVNSGPTARPTVTAILCTTPPVP